MLGKTHRPFAVACTATVLMLVHDRIPTYDTSSMLVDGIQVVETLGASCIGGILPDIDIILPIPHRTITHAIWIPMIAMIVAFKMFTGDIWIFPALFGATIGYLSHLLGDAFSSAGLAWFWPLQTYARYPGGAFTVKGPRGPFIPLYHAGEGPAFISMIWRMIAVLMVMLMSWRIFAP